MEHELVEQYINHLFQTAGSMYDTEMVDTAKEVSDMLCGPEGCNCQCTNVCEAMKFLVRSILWNVTSQTEEFQALHETYKSMLVDHLVANYG